MKNKNQFLLLYKKNLRCYLIVSQKNYKILWKINLDNFKVIDKNYKYVRVSKNLNDYFYILLNLSVFGLYPIQNDFEFFRK